MTVKPKHMMAVVVVMLSIVACAGDPVPGSTPPQTATATRPMTPVPATTEAPVEDVHDDSTPGADPVIAVLAAAPLSLGVGGISEVTLSVTDVEDLYAVEVHLRFDPAILDIVDAEGRTDGVRVTDGSLLDVGFSVVNAVDNLVGSMDYAVTQMPPTRAVSGSGDLLRFVVKGEAPGVTTLKVESIILASSKGAAIPISVDATQATLAVK